MWWEYHEKAEKLLKPLIETEGKNMGLSLEDTSFARYFRKGGFEEGKEEGVKEKAIEIAKNLLKMNLSIEAICEATGLTLEEVKELNK